MISQRFRIIKKIAKNIWIFHEDIIYKTAYLVMKVHLLSFSSAIISPATLISMLTLCPSMILSLRDWWKDLISQLCWYSSILCSIILKKYSKIIPTQVAFFSKVSFGNFPRFSRDTDLTTSWEIMIGIILKSEFASNLFIFSMNTPKTELMKNKPPLISSKLTLIGSILRSNTTSSQLKLSQETTANGNFMS